MNCRKTIQFMKLTASIHDRKVNSCRRQFIEKVYYCRGYIMKDNPLIDLSRQFAVDIIKLYDTVRETKKHTVIINQLLRCGTSIGANIHEGNYAASRADFVNKFQIALKECYETEYWLNIMSDAGIIGVETYNEYFAKCSKIRKLLSASLRTAKDNE